MRFDFETPAERRGIGNLKAYLSSEAIRAAGIENYCAAEMDFRTAPSVIDAMAKFAQNGLMGFTLCDEPYQAAVQGWMRTQRSWQIEKDWIVPTLGTIFSVATAIRMTTAVGQGVIVQPPIYNRYEQAAIRLKRKTVYNRLLESQGAYRIDFENLELLMADPHNRLLVLCNPQNPIGRVWPREDLERIARLAERYGVTVFSDEIFAEITFDGHSCVPYGSIPGAARHAITSTSLGKTFNFTGANHANLVIPDDRLRAAFIQQRDADHYGSIDPMTYAAVIGAYSEEGARWKCAMVTHVAANLACIQDFFHQHLPQVRISPCEGSFVIWIDWRALGLDDAGLGHFLNEEALFALDPGVHYCQDQPGYTRMSIATTRRQLDRSLDLLLEAARARGFAR